MPDGLKELIVVVVLASVMFRLARPIALRFTAAADFSRRRTVWFVLTVVAFLSPDFWIFALVAVPLLLWAQRRDTHPVALYLALLQVIPPVSVDIPVVGINQLFTLDIYRLLSFCVLFPTAWRLRRRQDLAPAPARLGLQDILLLGYGALLTVLYVPPDLPQHVILPDSATNLVRRAFLFFTDVYILYFVVSRSCRSRGAIIDALAAFSLSSALLAPVAVFETVRGWLLYIDIPVRWSGEVLTPLYSMRGTMLRAMVSTNGPLVLGYVLAVGFGFWLYLGSKLQSRPLRAIVTCIYVAGLLAAYSRGPWIGAIVIYLAYIALRPGAVTRVFKAVAVMATAIGALLASPFGERITSVMPFMGGAVDSYNVLYRQRLAQRSWQLIQQRPFFGDQLAYQKMEDLRQGMGIIDLVNAYASVALFYGLVGLALFLSFFLLGLLRARRLAWRVAQADPDLALLGVTLVAGMIGTLVMIVSSSLIFQYAIMFYVLGGLAAAYASLGERTASPIVTTMPDSARE